MRWRAGAGPRVELGAQGGYRGAVGWLVVRVCACALANGPLLAAISSRKTTKSGSIRPRPAVSGVARRRSDGKSRKESRWTGGGRWWVLRGVATGRWVCWLARGVHSGIRGVTGGGTCNSETNVFPPKTTGTVVGEMWVGWDARGGRGWGYVGAVGGCGWLGVRVETEDNRGASEWGSERKVLRRRDSGEKLHGAGMIRECNCEKPFVLASTRVVWLRRTLLALRLDPNREGTRSDSSVCRRLTQRVARARASSG